MKKRTLSENFFGFRHSSFFNTVVLSFLATFQSQAQEPPPAPPDIDVPTSPSFTPINPEPWVIPPFNGALPESTTLGEEQSVVLRAVSTDSSLTAYQWFKDGEALPGKTRDSLEIEIVSPDDAGVYRVDVGEGSSLISSTEIEFIIVPLSEIDELFSEWLGRFFSSEELGNPEITGESADPDSDGVANLAEYAFGLNPLVRNTPPKLGLNDGETASPFLVFMRAKGRDNVVFTVEGSSTLTDWVPLSVIATRIEPTEQSTDSVEIEVDWDLSPNFPRFLKLKVEQIIQP